MLIDWFTVIAQLINFLILVYLLQRFLYKPIVKTIADRDRQIEQQWNEAHRSREVADREAKSYRQQQEQLEQQRDRWLAEAREEAEKCRKSLVEEARSQVDRMRAQWHSKLRRDRHHFVENLQNQLVEETDSLTRRVLRDLADIDLEEREIAQLIDRLHHLSDRDREQIREALNSSDAPILIRTRFALSPETREEFLNVMGRELKIDGVDVNFKTSDRVIGGITLNIGGYQIAWTIESYLQGVRDRFRDAIDRVTVPLDREESDRVESEENREKALQVELVRQSYTIARRVLKDFADEELQNRAIDVFLRQLKQLDERDRDEIARSIRNSGQAIAIRTSFKLSQSTRQQLIDRLQECSLLDLESVEFVESSDLDCGIQLKLGDREIGWTLDGYFQNLETELMGIEKELQAIQ
ncbi:hypothetical protein JJD41_16665 [Oxynema sp. CENA135]|uniref:F0F1 ATP synthase subunit B family protein n=1 Tax=Oxynema sp. CENA135 TaxID=984206 RepID=UPI001909786C|nr:hypothetical protein [Oxynema sp. CENA135]